VVRVVELKEIPPASWSTGRTNWRTLIYAVNESSGRKITIRSPQRLRSRVDQLPSNVLGTNETSPASG
jgi:hypothetical protein